MDSRNSDSFIVSTGADADAFWLADELRDMGFVVQGGGDLGDTARVLVDQTTKGKLVSALKTLGRKNPDLDIASYRIAKIGPETFILRKEKKGRKG